ncbi:hypothetical protein BCR34DRAFT_492387 [Clohesyomyces aquaticus]|uniref:AtmA protein n=1 Tax=Clohesyomyces aquaticus TaxID=1231657 RepID=A0A1Y1YZU6_9PLEO|nr:hypothetical protein BCR34DRAFT_492387 [Clohesyomyces aquaticus]
MAIFTQRSNPLFTIILLALSAYAFYATWGISLIDGTLGHMLAIRGAKIPLIPGTHEPLRLHFTGIPPIDYWYTIMVLFFWEAVDGSHPATSLTGIYFLGQLVAVWTLIYVEGNRISNQGLTVAKTLLWTLLMQNLTLACFGPIYFVIHLAVSPMLSSSSSTKESPTKLSNATKYLQYLPLSITLGYIVPSIFIGLPAPTIQSYASQQAAIAVWTPFPAWVALFQVLLTWCDSKLSSSSTVGRSETSKAYQAALRRVYIFAITGSAFIHIGTITTSMSTVLFPAVYSPIIRSEFAPAHLLFPDNASVDTIGAGVLTFMQWDQWIGYTAVLAWALKLLWEVRAFAGAAFVTRVWQVLETVGTTLLLGPGSAAVLLIWKRDETAWAGEQRPEKATGGF